MVGFDLKDGDFVNEFPKRDWCLDVLNRLHVDLRGSHSRWLCVKRVTSEVLLKSKFDPLDDSVPIAIFILAEQSHGGIPEGGIRFQSPTPFRDFLEEKPCCFAHATSEVSDSGIAGDDEVAVGDDRSSFEEIPGVINLILAADEMFFERACIELFAAKALLKR